jgi:hypothetical protein
MPPQILSVKCYFVHDFGRNLFLKMNILLEKSQLRGHRFICCVYTNFKGECHFFKYLGDCHFIKSQEKFV